MDIGCHMILNLFFVSLLLQAVTTLKCYSCHYAYQFKKDDGMQFTDAYYNERNAEESRVHESCGDDKPISDLLVQCPVSKNPADAANTFCWMGVKYGDTMKAVARGCEVRGPNEFNDAAGKKRNACWPTEHGPSDETTECFCNTGDGCADWKYHRQLKGKSMKESIGGEKGGAGTGSVTIIPSLIIFILSAITIFSF